MLSLYDRARFMMPILRYEAYPLMITCLEDFTRLHMVDERFNK